ncbi:MAG TPA: hypothetical protein DEP87_00595, partial [Candidatus Pacebacteria bacterium]|nr:hypothetical protein [Candidatus Paceibacterota bacterium]
MGNVANLELFTARVNAFFLSLGWGLLVVILLVLATYLVYLLYKHRDREKYALDFVTLLVRLPKGIEIKIDAAEQMFAGLYAIKHDGWFDFLKPEEVISFEIVGLREEIGFYISCPRKIRDLVEKQVNGAYPTAEIKIVDEVNIFNEKGRVAYTTLTLEKGKYLPLKTFKDLPTDGLSLITSALSKMGEGEGAMIQLLVQPVGKSWQDAGRDSVQKQKKRESDPQKANYSADPKEMEAINNKLDKPGFKTSLRIVVSAQNEVSANVHLNNIVGAFAQFTSPHNSFVRDKFIIGQLFMLDFIYRYLPIWDWGTSVLNTEELATVMHFPNKSVETHHIKWLIAKNAPASNLIPTSGLRLGKSMYRGEVREVFMENRDRQRHTYIIGKTGTGKS